MTPSPLPLSDCSHSSSSIRLILSLLVAFFVFAYIPLGVEGEYCSTSPSHYVECSDPNANCINSTSTSYGICNCSESYKTIYFADVTRRFFKTQCLKPRHSIYVPCNNSLQCQFEDDHTLCTTESHSPDCQCRDIDGYSLGFETNGCVSKKVPESGTDWFLFGVIFGICLLPIVLCLIVRRDFNRVYDRIFGPLFHRRLPNIPTITRSSALSLESTPLNPVIDEPTPSCSSQYQAKLSPIFEDAISQISSVSLTFSPQSHQDPSYSHDPLPPCSQEPIPSCSSYNQAASSLGYEDAVSRISSSSHHSSSS